MEIAVYNIAGQEVGKVAVDQEALGGTPNMDLVRQAIIMFEANQRVGTTKVKTRSTVHGTGRKPWAQKHTGRARHGSRTTPLWPGGGVAHGPQPRDYRQKMNKAARRKALRSAFLAKVLDGEVMAVDGLELPALKTKAMATVLENLGVARSFLIVTVAHDADLWRCTRNIPGAAMLPYADLSVYQMIRPNRVIFVLGALEGFLKGACASADRPEEPATVEAGQNG